MAKEKEEREPSQEISQLRVKYRLQVLLLQRSEVLRGAKTASRGFIWMGVKGQNAINHGPS